jgi:hypothetical protein
VTWKRKTAIAASALLLAAGGTLATASPAAADGPCPKNRLCIWDDNDFRGQRIASGSTNACFTMGDFSFVVIVSYDNNLPVDAIVWHRVGNRYDAARTLVANGFSSRIGDPGLGLGHMDKVCMGNARP